jgi:hypothetical protein
MSKRSSRDFAQAEIECVMSSIDNLLTRYVRPGSALCVALDDALVDLGHARAATHEKSQYRRKPVGRYVGGAR